MEDQQEPKKGQGVLSMGEIGQALPQVSSNAPSSPRTSYSSNFPQYQYQTSSPAPVYPAGQYQQPYTGGQSETPYYSFALGQQQSDPTQLQIQYGGQVGYRSPVASQAGLPQYPSGVQRPMQQAQPQAYNIPRYQYQQQYPQALGARAMSIPGTYATSPPTRSPQQFASPPSYPLYPPSYLSASASPLVSDEASIDPDHLLPRGPPRKPKQSGFALWVGNLPRDVLLEELKEFFALDGLESIFLIRKSNCAFVNYKTDESCSLALSMFNDKMFKNVRLVCRLRKSSPARTPTVGSSVSSSAISSSQTLVSDVAPTESITPLPEKTMGDGEKRSATNTSVSASPAQTPSNRYFIMKSLTKEDLAWSVNNKVWATQPHNESLLNDAFRNSENVYLFFSVNKSGEFFGYAKMNSEINDRSSIDVVKNLEPGTEVQVSDPPVILAGPKTTVTPKTDSAPRGKIFEDEVRGTVFWEVSNSSDEEERDEDIKQDERWGNPFRVEWIKWENPLPFQRTRLLRNPWNGNREVKISRDGTELETSVGARLLKEFDTESPNIPFGANTETQSQRRMSYPMAPFRPMPPTQLVYQQVPQIQPQGVNYVPYTALQQAPQPIIYGYGQGQGRGGPQQPYGGSGQPYYGQPPPQQ